MIASMNRSVLFAALAAAVLLVSACASGTPHKGELPLPKPTAQPSSQPAPASSAIPAGARR